MRVGVSGRFAPLIKDGDTATELTGCILNLGHEVVPFPDYVTPGLPSKVAALLASDPLQPVDAMIRVGFGHSPPARRLVHWLPDGGTPDGRADRVAVSTHAGEDETFVPWGVDPDVWQMPPRPRDRHVGTVWPQLSGPGVSREQLGLPGWVVEKDGGLPYRRSQLYMAVDVMARPDLTAQTGPDRSAIEYMAGGGILVVPKGTVPFGEHAGVVEYQDVSTLGASMQVGMDRRGDLEPRAERTVATQYSLHDTAERLVQLCR